MSSQKSVADSADNSDQDDVIFDATDWEKEAEKIGSSEWFKPSTGKQTLKFLNEGKEEERQYDEDEEVKKVQVFEILVGGEEKKWSVTKGQSESSLWGQLVKFAVDRGGLEGEEITLIRNGTGSDTQYVVDEAADL